MKSSRDFKPWETIKAADCHVQGIYLYQQAAREIADAQGWSDAQLVEFEECLISAINARELIPRCRKTGMPLLDGERQIWDLVSVECVNKWLENKGVPYRWNRSTKKKKSAVKKRAIKKPNDV